MKQVLVFILLVAIVVSTAASPVNKKSGKPSKGHAHKTPHRKFPVHGGSAHSGGGHRGKVRGPRALHEPFIFQDAPQLGGSRLGQDTDIYRSELEPQALRATKKYNVEHVGPERLGYILRPNSDGSGLITMPWKSKARDIIKRY